MNLYIGTDHRGNTIEKELVSELKRITNLEIITCNIEHSSEDDYPDFAFDVCKNIKDDDIGVLICGNGIGMSIAANKVKGIRCARVTNEEEAEAARKHNAANVIALGTFDVNEMIKLIIKFIITPLPTEERHMRRVNKIINYENGEYNEL